MTTPRGGAAARRPGTPSDLRADSTRGQVSGSGEEPPVPPHAKVEDHGDRHAKSSRKAKKTKVHRHKYQENPRGLFFCRCGRAIALGFLGQVMLD